MEQKVEVERVLRDMWQETKTPLLVYATEDAITAPRSPLPAALERFVKADNRSFRQEQSQERSRAESSPVPADVVSPSKRKHRADSLESLASDRASLGSLEMNDRDDPFASHNEDATAPMEDYRTGDSQTVELIDAFDVGGRQASTRMDNTSSTAFADTQASAEPNRVQLGEFTGLNSADVAEVKSPEMKERDRPPAFLAKPADDVEKPRSVNTMEMEIPDHHD
jgi:hypothetical protein